MTSGCQNYRFGKPYKLFIWWTTTYWYTSDHTKHFNIWSHQPDTTHAMLPLSRHKHQEQNSTNQKTLLYISKELCEYECFWLSSTCEFYIWKKGWQMLQILQTCLFQEWFCSNNLAWSCLSKNRPNTDGQKLQNCIINM